MGIDTVDIGRFERQLSRTPKLRDRLFAPHERELPLASLAARFAAREALIKSLGGSHDLGWHDMAVVRGERGAPTFTVQGRLAAVFDALGANRVHLSMSHDGGIAIASVIVEAVTPAASQTGGAA